jgi:hypothetical protein
LALRQGVHLGEDEAAAWLERDDRLDVLVPDRRQPPGPARLGVGEQNTRANSGEQRRHGIGNHCCIVWTGVGRDRAEELVQRLRLSVELDAVKIARPIPDPELVEEELVKGRRLDCRSNGAIAGAAAPRLVDEIDWEASTQEERLEALASVGRRLPTPRRLECAMQHDDRQCLRVLRHLIEGVKMIAVETLSYSGGLVVVVSAGRSQHGAANGEAALPFENDGRLLGSVLRHGCFSKLQTCSKQQDRNDGFHVC